jgi:hypothetical protein
MRGCGDAEMRAASVIPSEWSVPVIPNEWSARLSSRASEANRGICTARARIATPQFSRGGAEDREGAENSFPIEIERRCNGTSNGVRLLEKGAEPGAFFKESDPLELKESDPLEPPLRASA